MMIIQAKIRTVKFWQYQTLKLKFLETEAKVYITGCVYSTGTGTVKSDHASNHHSRTLQAPMVIRLGLSVVRLHLMHKIRLLLPMFAVSVCHECTE